MTCRWMGEGEGCDKEAVKGRNYCEEHYSKVYQVGSSIRRKKDSRIAQAVWNIESEFNQAVLELITEGYDFNEDRWSKDPTSLDDVFLDSQH